MIPPLFVICSNNQTVTSILGDDPVRIFPFGIASDDTERPYAVWQTVSGLPENYLTDIPDIDRYTVQVDVYAETGSESEEASMAIRDAVETHADSYISAWRGETKDPETGLFRYMFDVSFFVKR